MYQSYAGDCNYCKALAPLWAQLSRERTEEYIAVVDCITEEILCAAWDINSVPAMFLYKKIHLQFLSICELIILRYKKKIPGRKFVSI